MVLGDRKRYPYILFALTIATLLLNPYSYDPSALPKWIATWIAVTVLILPSFKSLWKTNLLGRKILVFACTLSILAVTRAILSNDIYQGIYGTFQRYNGALFIVMMLLIFLVVASSFTPPALNQFHIVWIFLCNFEASIGIAQWRGFQLIKAQNQNTPVLGTFGNPNHLSAFLGFGLIICFYFTFFSNTPRMLRAISSLTFLHSAVVIVISASIQGIFVFATGVVVLILITYYQNRLKFISFFLVFLTLAIFSIFGMLNKGPFATLLFQESNLQRADYWRAAFRAIQSKPLLGSGPDQFAYAYAILRDKEAIQRASSIVTDNAHNWPLQIASTYGLPFALLFFFFVSLIFFLTLKEALKKLRKESVVLSFSLFSAFLVQTLISVEHSVISGWGFFFGGMAFANTLNTSSKTTYQESQKLARLKRNRKSSVSWMQVITVLVGLLVIIPPVGANAFLTHIDRGFFRPGSTYQATEIAKTMELLSPIGNGDVRIWLAISNIRYGAGDISGVEYLLNRIREHFPNNSEIYNYLAQFEFNRNDFSKSLEYRKKVWELNPGNTENLKTIMSLAIALKDKSSYDWAIVQYEKYFNQNTLTSEQIWPS